MPGVMECAVVGVPDEKMGEAVKLVIVRKDPELTEAQVREFCRANLTGYKQPRVIEFREELPKTPWAKSCGVNCATRSEARVQADAPQSRSGFGRFFAFLESHDYSHPQRSSRRTVRSFGHLQQPRRWNMRDVLWLGSLHGQPVVLRRFRALARWPRRPRLPR